MIHKQLSKLSLSRRTVFFRPSQLRCFATEAQSDNTTQENQSFITREFYTLPKKEVISRFYTELKPFVDELTQKDGYKLDDCWALILGKKELKFPVISYAMKKFGREIPNHEISKLNKVGEVVMWFVNKIESEKAKPTLSVPDNVSLFIDQVEKKRKVMELEKSMADDALGRKPKNTEQKI